MLKDYQILQQLNYIKKSYEFDAPKSEALEFAIEATQDKINKCQPCFFDHRDSCFILTKKNCLNCSFRRTKDQYMKDQAEAEERLRRRGIKAEFVKSGEQVICTAISLTNNKV